MTDEERRNKKKEYFSITQMANIMDIKTDTLRFYDKIGLFVPNYTDPVNGRRYYSPAQCDILGTILELRKMQISIKDIMEFMNRRTLDKSEEILKAQLEFLAKEIVDKKRLKTLLEEKLDFIEKQRKKEFELNTPLIRKIPKRYAMFGELGTTTSCKVAMDYMNMEKSIYWESPLFASNNIAMELTADMTGKVRDNMIRPVLFCTKPVEKDKRIQEIKDGNYVCIYLRNEKGNLGEEIKRIKDYAQQQNFKIAGHGFLIYQIDVTLTDDPSETLVEIQFPIEEL